MVQGLVSVVGQMQQAQARVFPLRAIACRAASHMPPATLRLLSRDWAAPDAALQHSCTVTIGVLLPSFGDLA